jgi:glycopeptide antibiotics resistance protein
MLANTLLFVPVGFSCAMSGRGVGGAAVIGGAFSMAVEMYQVYCHGRFPSATDVWWNVTGTAVGAMLYKVLVRQSSGRRR